MGEESNLEKYGRFIYKVMESIKVSVCITTFNEAGSVKLLIDSLLKQTKRVNEIVVVDSKSSDSTTQIIKEFRRKFRNIRLVSEKCSRAEGRNMCVKKAKYGVIAMTDAGCTLQPRWLERITKPFRDRETDIVAGFYKMKSKTPFQKALSVFLGKIDFDDNFLPSTRSIAFTRKIWRRVGGFPENLDDTAEDMIFNYKAIKKGAKIARVKNAIVYWSIPQDIKTGMKKIYSYAKGDARSKLFWHPAKKFGSHNIKVLLVFLRYAVGLVLGFLAFNNHLFLIPIGFFLIFYIFWSFYKVYRKFNDLKVGVWGVILQFLADLSVMAGFSRGIIS